jgi:hypothetical protein
MVAGLGTRDGTEEEGGERRCGMAGMVSDMAGIAMSLLASLPS